MMRAIDAHLERRQAVVAAALGPVARDVALLDAADVIALVRFGRFAELSSLIDASIELSFRAGTLMFGHGGSISIDWHRHPVVHLDMEFRHHGVEVYFRLIIDGRAPSIEIDFVRFDGALVDPDANTARLAQALGQARIADGCDQLRAR
jgi:hypothetical protein